MIGIYKITNKINGKCYIGQSINIIQRFREHKSCKADKPLYRAFKKYGLKNFKFEILEECTKEKLNEKEIYYIAFYNSTTDGNGYNLEHGGEFKDIILCEEAKQKQVASFKKTVANMPKEDFEEWHKKIGAKHKGKIISQDQREKISKTLKEYFKDEENRKRLSEQRKGVPMSLSARLKLSMVQQVSMQKYAKKVLQYDLNDNLIAEHDSLQEASKRTGYSISGIVNCCNRKAHTCNGYKWKYDEEFNKKYRKSTNRIIKPKPPLKGQPSEVPKRWKKVYQYDECYNLIKIFDSFKQVAEEFGEYKNVSAVCRGKRKHAYGYRWSYNLINKEK